MIDIDVRIHDKFSVEFKTGFVVDKKSDKDDFIMNTWIFVPNSLDINSESYPKYHFYRDAKSHTRLITPKYSLEELADDNAYPYLFLQVAFNELVAEPSENNMAEVEYQIKMFISIVKSALRQAGLQMLALQTFEECRNAINQYVQNLEKITILYRDLRQIIEHIEFYPKALTCFSFGDEFFSNRIEHKTFELIRLLKEKYPEESPLLNAKLLALINKERKYKQHRGYEIFRKSTPEKNSELLYRLRLLKKYIENHLFLNAKKKKDGRLAQQLSVSMAAGLAMVFATIITFSAQQKYGNFTTPLFVVLVFSYMLKDQIKERSRSYFATRLSKKYFDNKTEISIKKTPLGWSKEGVDFIPLSKLPEKVIEKRNQSDLLETDHQNAVEKVILYRKLVRIDGEVLDNNIQYDVVGINDIFRFNLYSFIMKMNDPVIPLSVPTKDGSYDTILGKFVYYINFIMQLKHNDYAEYKRFRLVISREGIERIDKL